MGTCFNNVFILTWFLVCVLLVKDGVPITIDCDKADTAITSSLKALERLDSNISNTSLASSAVAISRSSNFARALIKTLLLYLLD